MNGKNTVHVPQISSIETALQIYYSRTSLNNADVKKIFNSKLSSATVSRLKALARDRMAEKGIPAWNGADVDVVSAYEAWHIDVSDLEKRLRKLNELKILTAVT